MADEQKPPAQHAADRPPEHRTQLTVTYAAPLPPAGMVEHYERVLPGAAERLFSAWEAQAGHRQKLESKKIDADINAEKRSHLSALVVTILVVVLGSVLIWADKDVAGLVMILGELTILAGIFIYGRHRQEAERAEQRRPVEERESASPSTEIT